MWLLRNIPIYVWDVPKNWHSGIMTNICECHIYWVIVLLLKREEVNQRVAVGKVPKEGLRPGSRWDIGLGKVIGGDSQSLEYLGVAGYFTQTAQATVVLISHWGRKVLGKGGNFPDTYLPTKYTDINLPRSGSFLMGNGIQIVFHKGLVSV